MTEPNEGLRITAVEDVAGNTSLLLEGAALTEHLLARSATLRGLLDLNGDAPLPIERQHFELWRHFNEETTYNVQDLAVIVEVRHARQKRTCGTRLRHRS